MSSGSGMARSTTSGPGQIAAKVGLPPVADIGFGHRRGLPKVPSGSRKGADSIDRTVSEPQILLMLRAARQRDFHMARRAEPDTSGNVDSPEGRRIEFRIGTEFRP